MERQVAGEPGTQLDEDTIQLDVPAAPRSLRLLRLAVADAAASAGLDLERVDSARLVIDELSSLVIGGSGGGRLLVCITTRPGAVDFVGSAPAGGVIEPDLIVEELLNVSVGKGAWSVEQGEDAVRFRATVDAR